MESFYQLEKVIWGYCNYSRNQTRHNIGYMMRFLSLRGMKVFATTTRMKTRWDGLFFPGSS